MGVGRLAGIFVSLVAVGIILVVGLLVISQAKEQLGEVEGIDETNSTDCATSVACNATAGVQESLDTAVDFMPIIVITAVGVVLIGMVMLFKQRRN